MQNDDDVMVNVWVYILKRIIWTTILLCFYYIFCHFRELCSINHHPLSFYGQQKLLDSNLTSIFRFHGKEKQKKLEQHKGWGQYFNFWVNYSFKASVKTLGSLFSKYLTTVSDLILLKFYTLYTNEGDAYTTFQKFGIQKKKRINNFIEQGCIKLILLQTNISNKKLHVFLKHSFLFIK